MYKRVPVLPAFKIGSWEIPAGSRETIDIPVSVLSDHTPISMSVHVIHGRQPGPTLFVSAATHGDEVIGVEVVRRLLQSAKIKNIKGTLLAIPIVNAYGFMNHSRYLPDRRDLNRSFPGSPSGSLAARLAHIFMSEIVARSDVGIDLHSAAIHRTNLPQIRVTPNMPKSKELARVFGAPLTLTSPVRDKSLRASAQASGVDVLVYEAGEGLRFDEFSVRAGVSGTLRVMRHLKMIPKTAISKSSVQSISSGSSFWTRASIGGLLRTHKTIGEEVKSGDLLGVISDPFGDKDTEILAEQEGLVMGRTNLPVVNEGDALFHIAKISKSIDAEAKIDELASQLVDEALLDEDEII